MRRTSPGPIWWMAPLMIPIEIISTLARPLSLSVRLFANMYAGEQVTLVFLSLTYLVAPAIVHGAARLCRIAAGVYFRSADDDLRGGRSRRSTLSLSTGFMPFSA